MSRDQLLQHFKKVHSESVCDVIDLENVVFGSDVAGPSSSDTNKQENVQNISVSVYQL